MIFRLLLLGLCLLTLLGCGRSRLNLESESTPQPIYGTESNSFTFTKSFRSIKLEFTELPAEGVFVDLNLPEGQTIVDESWTDDSGTLHLIAANGRITQLGIVPLEGYDGQRVSVGLSLDTSSRAQSVLTPQAVSRNDIFDLAISEVNSEQVRLSWSQVNTGDYDFNSEVNIADLSPLGRYLNAGIDTNYPPYLQTAFWVDGDRNGEITISDLTPLGAYLGTQVAGYIVKRNGVRLGDSSQPFTVTATLGKVRPGLPPLQTHTFEGDATDSWEVETVNALGGATGADSGGEQSRVDVHLTSLIDGVDLLSPYGSGTLNNQTGDTIMRVVLPGYDVDNAELPGEGLRNYPMRGEADFSGLPRGVPLCADIIYVPAVDLATGQVRNIDNGSSGQPFPTDYYVYTRVPFILPPGTATLDLDAQIVLNPAPGGGYYIDMLARSTIGGAITERRTRLNYAAGELAYDSDGDGSYGDEPLLMDSWRTSISNNLRQRSSALENYASQAEARITGVVSEVDMSNGQLVLSTAMEQVIGSAAVDVSGVQVKFTELTDFHQRIAGVGELDLDVFSTLQVGDTVEIGLTRFVDGAETPATLRIAESVVRVADNLAEDTIYADPAVQLAYPGQAVRIFVRTTPTAGQLRTANVQISYPAGCHYKPNSFDVGTYNPQVSGQWDVDGLWALTDATQFIRPPGDFPEVQVGSRTAIDVPLLTDAVNGAIGASGDLFSFELIVNSTTDLAFIRGSLAEPLTAYFDNGGTAHFWTNDSNAGQPIIEVAGTRPVISLESPIPPEGNGTAGSPYLIATPADFQLSLTSNGSNVTASPDTVWSLNTATNAAISSSGMLHMDAAFEGLLKVTATYRGVPNTDVSTLHFFVGPPKFSAQIDAAATFANGGGGIGEFSTIMIDHGSTVEVQVLGENLQGLKALYFDLPFNPAEFEFSHYDGVQALEDADAATSLLKPGVGRPIPVLIDTDNKAHLRFGMAMPKPLATEGFSGGGSLVSLHFAKNDASGVYADRTYLPPTGLSNRPGIKQAGTAIQWDYVNEGDTNQNGLVEYSDYNPIALLFDSPPPPNGTTADVADCNNDNEITAEDSFVVEDFIDQRVELYRVYGGAAGSYPVGTQLATIAFDQKQGAGQGIRLYFEYEPESPYYDQYWVVPVAGGIEGERSFALSYTPTP